MGYYINPKNESKEDFLMREGMRALPELPEDKSLSLVCLVNNGFFTAAGVCYNQYELDAFNSDDDKRPKKWYYVPTKLLYDVVSENLERVIPRD